MNWHKFTTLLFLLLIIVTFPWGVDQVWAQQQYGNGNGTAYKNQLNDAQNAAAEVRKAKGMGRTTTNDARKAAAKRTAERKALHKAKLKAKGGAAQ
jgi:uncharacterized iron-regulated membrane protein